MTDSEARQRSFPASSPRWIKEAMYMICSMFAICSHHLFGCWPVSAPDGRFWNWRNEQWPIL